MSIVSIKELKKMKPGQKMTLSWSHPMEAFSVQTVCSRVTMNYPELKLRLRTRKNREKKTITITAEENEQV